MQHINDLLKIYSSQNNFNATEDFYFFEIYLQMSSLDGQLYWISRLDARQDEKTRWSARWDEQTRTSRLDD